MTTSATSLDDLLAAGAARCASAVAAGDASALELCDAAIARIEAIDGQINAVVVRDFERAREQARAADALRARGERKPLLGVPMTVKESFNVAGLPTSWGIPPFKDYVPDEDAVAVQRLKAAGAVILGKTNVAPGLADFQSDNPVYGRTSHPMNPARTPGGSSGGSAAALASGMVALELGSDMMGSIRIPAHFCGVYGHKPSPGVLPMRGHDFPRTHAVPGDMPTVIGPLARRAEDLDLVLDAIAGPDIPDSKAYRLALPPARHARLGDFRVFVLTEHPSTAASGDVREAVDSVARRMEKAGARVERSSALLPDLADVQSSYVTMVMTLLSAFEPGGTSAMTAQQWIHLMARRGAIRAGWRAFFEQFDVLLCPAFGTAAFEHQVNPDWDARTLSIDGRQTPYGAQGSWATMASFGGLPATVAPVTQDADGMPLGVQIVGPQLEDRTTIALARMLATA